MPLLTRVGAAATKTNIMADVRTAFVAAGWSESATMAGTGDQRSYGYPSGAETQYIAVDFRFDAADTGPFTALPTWGQNTANTIDNQPRGPGDAVGSTSNQTRARGMSNANVNSWVFYDEPVANVVSYVHVVIEAQAGLFVHWDMGVLEKAGAYANGTYTCGTSARFELEPASQCIWAFIQPSNAAPEGANWFAVDTTLLGANVVGAEASAGTGGGALEFVKNVHWAFHQQDNVSISDDLILQALQMAGVDQRTGLTPMNPIYAVMHDTTLDVRVLLGTVPDCRYANIEGLGSGLKIVTVGADSWYVFPYQVAGTEPLFQFDGPSSTISDSGMFGLAYKLVP